MRVENVQASDEDLVSDAAQEGESRAIELLYIRHHDAGLLLARRLVGNTFDAEDIASEAFLKVVSAIRRGKGPNGPFRPYLFRAVRTCAADHWAAQSRQAPTETVEAPPEVDPHFAAVLEGDDHALAASAFASLPVRWQTVLWHLDVEGEPPRRVAPLLGLEPNAVSAVALRARKGLRQAYLQAYVSRSLEAQCHPTLPLLSKSALGRLTSSERARLQGHADGCLKCTKALLDMQDVRATMRKAIGPWLLGLPLLPAVCWPGPVAMVDRPLFGMNRRGLHTTATIPGGPWFTAAALAVVVAVGGIVVFTHTGNSNSGPSVQGLTPVAEPQAPLVPDEAYSPATVPPRHTPPVLASQAAPVPSSAGPVRVATEPARVSSPEVIMPLPPSTASPAETALPTLSRPPTPTTAASQSATPSASPSAAPSATPSASPSATPSATPSPEVTTPVPSNTATLPTASPTPTPGPSCSILGNVMQCP